MKTKKILSILATFLILSTPFSASANVNIKNIETNKIKITTLNLDKELSRTEVFNFLGDILTDIPQSYKYIKLEYIDVLPGTELYKNLQKLVYIDAIKNIKAKISPRLKISSYYFYKLVGKIIGYDFVKNKNIENLKNKQTNLKDINIIKETLVNFSDKKLGEKLGKLDPKLQQKFEILFDVYTTLGKDYYNKDSIDKEKLLYSAIEGMAKGAGDKHTTYFPPVEKKDFLDSLNSEYEGIGAYVDLIEPGLFKIISPLNGSPAEKAGIKGGDIVKKVDGKEITKENSSKEIISWIKGKSGTSVELEIQRGEEILTITIVRKKITLKEVEGKKIGNDNYYINIKIFGATVADEFKDQILELKKESGIKNLILDLRNNPGGYLGEVNKMLGYFVEKGEPVILVKYQDGNIVYRSKGYDLYDFSNMKIYILVNSGTASASEILTGTLKDYYPNLEVLGEKTYGKGSVQTIKSYADNSSLKYTVAKWFTGKTNTGIDGIGISPDIELKIDKEKAKKGEDSQLDDLLDYIKTGGI